MDVFDIIGYLSTIIALASLPINIIFLRLLYKFRHCSPFSSSFFVLCRQLTIIDILIVIFSTIFFKFSTFGWIPKVIIIEKFAVLPVLGINYLGHVQAIAIIGIALNRFTAVFTPHRHRDYWWNSTNIEIFIFLQWFLPILFVIPLFFSNFSIEMDEFLYGITFYAKNYKFHKVRQNDTFLYYNSKIESLSLCI